MSESKPSLPSRRSFLQQMLLATGGSAALAAALNAGPEEARGTTAPAADAAAGARSSGLSLERLDSGMSAEEKVRLIERFVHDRYYDPAGLMYSHSNLTEERPFTAADFTSQDSAIITSPDPAQWLSYENSAWNSGMFLASQCYRHQATGEAEALVFARRAFGSIDANYSLTEKSSGSPGLVQKAGTIDMGSQPRAPKKGFFCKPYGGLATTQTSTEQHFSPLFGLYLYRQIAPPEIRRRIVQIFGEVSERWRHGYAIDYFGESWDMERSFPRATRHMFTWSVIHRMAFEVTGDPASYDEFKRLDAQFGALPAPRETALGLGYPAYLSTEDRSFHGVTVLGADILAGLEAANAARYLRGMRAWWDFSFTGQRDDLLSYYFLKIDPVSGSWEKLPVSVKPRPLWTSPWMFKNGTWPVCMHDVALRQALSSAIVAKRTPAERERAIRHLGALYRHLSKSSLAWFADPDRVMPRELAWMTRTLLGDSLAFYPLGYWYARANGVSIA